MVLTGTFNLQSKTRDELKGVYLELFNQLADKRLTFPEKQCVQAALQLVKNAIMPSI